VQDLLVSAVHYYGTTGSMHCEACLTSWPNVMGLVLCSVTPSG